MRFILPPHCFAGQLDGVDVRAMGRVALEFLPAGDGSLLQFVLVADDVIVAAVFAHPEGQGQAPVALLGDHPVVHVAQPVQLSRVPEFGDPANLVDHVHDLVAQAALFFGCGDFGPGLVVQFAHADEPLIHQAEDQLGAAAPAGGIAVGVGFDVIEDALALQIIEDRLGHIGDVHAGQPAKALDEIAVIVERGQDGEVVLFAQVEVLGAAAGGDVDDAGAFALAHAIPGMTWCTLAAALAIAQIEMCESGW